MENEVKGLLQSRTFWGVIVSLIAKVLAALGWLSIDEQTEKEVVSSALALVSVVGDFIAIHGRINATQKIGKPE